MIKRLSIFIIACMLAACTAGSGIVNVDDMDTLYKPRYAKGFLLRSSGDRIALTVENPWQGAQGVKFNYILGNDNSGDIAIPVKRAIVMSSSYIAFLDALGECDKIVGCSGIEYVMNPVIQKMYADGKIGDVGYESGFNIERLISLKPDVVFIYGVNGENSVVGEKLNELGIKTVYIAEYLESDPLARAEWLVAMSAFFGKTELAQKIFDSIEESYNSIKLTAASCGTRPKVMLNSPWRDTWFVPGDRSYMVSLINDAGGEYICRGVDSEQSRAISIEDAYLKMQEADFWMCPSGDVTIEDIVSKYPRFAQVSCVKNGMVFNNNARMPQAGGSDFWESGVVRPHVILNDLITILHAEPAKKDEGLYYFRKLN